jgi:hypothetical protein
MRHLILRGPADKELKFSVINAGQGLAHAVGSEVTFGFGADTAVALPEGPLASD